MNAVTHGGESGVRAIHTGEPFRGPALAMQQQVEAQLETEGVDEVVRLAAIRLESVARLFYDAFLAAVDAKDDKKINGYSQRYGWLQFRALQAWEKVKKQEKESLDDLLDGEVVREDEGA